MFIFEMMLVVVWDLKGYSLVHGKVAGFRDRGRFLWVIMNDLLVPYPFIRLYLAPDAMDTLLLFFSLRTALFVFLTLFVLILLPLHKKRFRHDGCSACSFFSFLANLQL